MCSYPLSPFLLGYFVAGCFWCLVCIRRNPKEVINPAVENPLSALDENLYKQTCNYVFLEINEFYWEYGNRKISSIL